MQRIRSISHPKVRKWKAFLSTGQVPDGCFLSDHFRVIYHALTLGLVEELAVRENSNTALKFADHDNRYEITNEVAGEIGLTVNAFAIIRKRPKRIRKYERILLLDDVQDPFFLGTMMRTARCFGFDGIFLTGNSIDQWEPAVGRLAQTNIFELPVERLSFQDAVKRLKRNHSVLVTPGSRKAVALEDIQPAEHMAVLLSGTGSFVPELCGHSDIICRVNPGFSDPALKSHEAAVIMYELRNLKGEQG